MGSKRHEMFRDIKKMGFEIVNASKHFRVIDPTTGETLVVLPHGQNAYGGGRNGIAVMSKLRRYLKARNAG
jgi:hypothetical protein